MFMSRTILYCDIHLSETNFQEKKKKTGTEWKLTIDCKKGAVLHDWSSGDFTGRSK